MTPEIHYLQARYEMKMKHATRFSKELESKCKE